MDSKLRRASIIAIVITILGLFAWGSTWVQADTGSGGRHKTVSINVTQYVWQLISTQTGKPICEVMLEHEGTPTYEEAVTVCAQVIFPIERTPTLAPNQTAVPTPEFTPVPYDLDNLLLAHNWRLSETRNFTRTVDIPLPDIMLNISAPRQPVEQPYVIISAYDPAIEYKITGIKGRVNDFQFECPGTPCKVVVEADAVLEYWARSSSGDDSPHNTSSVRISIQDPGYNVTLSAYSTVTYFQDACMDYWGMNVSDVPAWAQFPIAPDQLNTNKSLHYLTGQLINYGLVDGKGCPGNGLFSALAPNACGMDKARQAATDWQNQFDPVIWLAGKDYGVPPRMIKTLIELESQFWPGNARYIMREFGLGQINQMGADVALRWDDELFKEVCNGLLYDCGSNYAGLPPWLQATVRGGLIKMINAECPTCQNGIDLYNARQSVPVIAMSLRSNCRQTKYIVDQNLAKPTYQDMWKFTMVSYHSGFQCLSDALVETKEDKEPMDWEHVSLHFNCADARNYVDDYWTALLGFENYKIQPEFLEVAAVQSVFIPTATPTATSTPVVAHSRVKVQIFDDANRNQAFDPGEGIEEMEVKITYADGSTLSRFTSAGEVIFDMTGRTIGSRINVAVPALYRNYDTNVIELGDMLIVFRIDPLALPTALP